MNGTAKFSYIRLTLRYAILQILSLLGLAGAFVYFFGLSINYRIPFPRGGMHRGLITMRNKLVREIHGGTRPDCYVAL